MFESAFLTHEQMACSYLLISLSYNTYILLTASIGTDMKAITHSLGQTSTEVPDKQSLKLPGGSAVTRHTSPEAAEVSWAPGRLTLE